MLRILIFTFSLLLISISGMAQSVVASRTAELQDELYEISGDAILERLDNGRSQIRLSGDYDTDWGPDVRLLLNNSVSSSGSVEVINLTTINHFNGAITLPLPSGVEIEDYNFVVFFCVNFNQLWASGQFGAVSGSEPTCKTSDVFGVSGASSYDICPGDGTADNISLSNSIGLSPGDEYVYLITDENEILVDVALNNFYNFESSANVTNRVYGMNYSGTLDILFGQHRLASNASGCFEHSSNTDFLTVTKNGCASQFECQESLTATTDWVTSVDICPSDGVDDILELRNNRLFEAGTNYAYLITDANQNLQEVVSDPFYNFEGSSNAEQRVYGVHFDGVLNPAIGQNRLNTTASGCFTHSGGNLFLTVTKSACEEVYECIESLTATEDWVTEVNICAEDGLADEVLLKNNVNVPPGINYIFLLTDVNEVLQEVIMDSIYNFDNTGLEDQRIYGMSYAGSLDIKLGEPRRNTSASDCFIHSGDDLFITINKTVACNTTSTVDATLAKQIDVFPNPSNGLVNINYNNLDIQFDQVILYDITGKKIKNLDTRQNFFIEQSGLYMLRFSNEEVTTTKRILIQ